MHRLTYPTLFYIFYNIYPSVSWSLSGTIHPPVHFYRIGPIIYSISIASALLPPVPFFLPFGSFGLVGTITISGIGTGARSCPRARRIGNDFIGNRVLGISLVFLNMSFVNGRRLVNLDSGSSFGRSMKMRESWGGLTCTSDKLGSVCRILFHQHGSLMSDHFICRVAAGEVDRRSRFR